MSESEARETQSPPHRGGIHIKLSFPLHPDERGIETAVECEYLTKQVGQDVYKLYDRIIGKLVEMQMNPQPWLIRR